MTIQIPRANAPSPGRSGRNLGLWGSDWIVLCDRQALTNPDNVQSDGSTQLKQMSRLIFQACASPGTVRMLYTNNRGTGDYTVRAGVDDGTTIAAAPFGGQRDITIRHGEWVWTDPVSVTVAQAAFLAARTYLTVASGTKFELNHVRSDTSHISGDGGTIGASATDQTTAGTVAVNATQYYGPHAIFYKPSGKVPVVLVVGDSISLYGGTADQQGFQRYAFAGTTSVLTAGQGGDTLAQFTLDNPYTSGDTRTRKLFAPGYGNNRVCEYGINDIYVDRVTLAVTKTRLIAAWTALDTGDGARLWQHTITPKTGADNAAGDDNTTECRLPLNTWLRDGAPMSGGAAVATGTVGASRCPVYSKTGALVTAASGPSGHPLTNGGIIDVADTVEKAADRSLWNDPTDFQDGLHLSDQGHAKLAGAYPVAAMTAP